MNRYEFKFAFGFIIEAETEEEARWILVKQATEILEKEGAELFDLVEVQEVGDEP